jgi:hypothetical protein
MVLSLAEERRRNDAARTRVAATQAAARRRFTATAAVASMVTHLEGVSSGVSIGTAWASMQFKLVRPPASVRRRHNYSCRVYADSIWARSQL